MTTAGMGEVDDDLGLVIGQQAQRASPASTSADRVRSSAAVHGLHHRRTDFALGSQHRYPHRCHPRSCRLCPQLRLYPQSAAGQRIPSCRPYVRVMSRTCFRDTSHSISQAGAAFDALDAAVADNRRARTSSPADPRVARLQRARTAGDGSTSAARGQSRPDRRAWPRKTRPMSVARSTR